MLKIHNKKLLLAVLVAAIGFSSEIAVAENVKIGSNNNNIIIGYPLTNSSDLIKMPVTNQNSYSAAVTPAQVSANGAVEATVKSNEETASVKKTAKVHFGKNVADGDGSSIVTKIGRKMMSAAGINKQVYFTYSTKDTVNAYTYVDGSITVFKGMMVLCEDEDELAFIIGHELGHADDYHVAKKIAVNNGMNIGASILKGVLNETVSSKYNTWGLKASKTTWTNLAVNNVEKMGNAKFARGQEDEADLKAIDYMVKCGYNPLAAVSILYKFESYYPDLFADHPSTEKRIRSVYSYVVEKYPQYISDGYDTIAFNDAYGMWINPDYDMQNLKK